VSGARALDGVAGFVEAPCFYPYLSGRKNLELCAAYDGGGEANRRIDESLDLVDLADRAKDRVGSYSHGMKQRLGIAGALIRNPKLLVLDEPTTGLDPAGMRDMRELVRRLASEGLTVMLSSHLMSEVEELCNRVAIIRGGSILFDGELDELLKSDGESRRLRSSDQAQAAVIATRLGIANRIGDSGELELTGGDDELISRYTVELGRAGVGIIELTTGRGSLEHFFFQLTEGESEAPALPAAEPEPAVAAAR
jgi:ABC-2 type transport system ATP-binding protein